MYDIMRQTKDECSEAEAERMIVYVHKVVSLGCGCEDERAVAGNCWALVDWESVAMASVREGRRPSLDEVSSTELASKECHPLCGQKMRRVYEK
jgi:hypothetical protein